MTKKGPVFGPQNVRKAGAQKWASPVQDSSRSCCWSNQFQLEINASTDLPQWRGQKGTKTGPSRGDHFWFQAGPLSDPFFKHVSLARGPKNGPSAGWIRCLLEGPVLSPPLHLLPLRCSNVETHQHHTSQHRVGNKGLEQGRPQLRLQNSYQFKVQKTNPKTSLLDLLVLIMTTCPFLLCWCKRSRASKACNRGALRLGEARRGLGEATPRTQNVLAQGQSEAHGDSKLYNTIVEVPGRLNLK